MVKEELVDYDLETRRKSAGIALSAVGRAIGIERRKLKRYEEKKKLPKDVYEKAKKTYPTLFE